MRDIERDEGGRVKPFEQKQIVVSDFTVPIESNELLFDVLRGLEHLSRQIYELSKNGGY